MIKINEIRDKEIEAIQKLLQDQLIKRMNEIDTSEQHRQNNILAMENTRIEIEKSLPTILKSIDSLINAAMIAIHKQTSVEYTIHTNMAGLWTLIILVPILTLRGFVCRIKILEDRTSWFYKIRKENHRCFSAVDEFFVLLYFVT